MTCAAQSAPDSSAQPPSQEATAPTTTLAQGPSAPSPDSTLYGNTVRDIQWRGAAAAQAPRVQAVIEQQVNQPLDRAKVRRSLQALHATGLFNDVQAEAERRPDGELTLVFTATERYFIGSLFVEGVLKPPPTPRQLLSSSKLQLGAAYSDAVLQAALERVKRALEDNGYYRAEVAATHTLHPETQLVDVVLQVQPGDQARVGTVKVEGDPGFSSEEVLRIAKLRPGERASTSRVSQALQRLRKKYLKEQRLELQISARERTYRPETNTVDYVLRVERGPRVEIEVEGANLRRGLIKQYIPVYEENAVDEDLLNEGRRNLRDYFQTKGFFETTVHYRSELDAAADVHRVIYTVNRGDSHKVVGIRILGNDFYDEEVIRERLVTREAGWLLPHGRFSQSLLNADIEAIEQLYRDTGFPQVKVTADVANDYQGKNGQLFITLKIEEGRLVRVASLRITGNHLMTEQRLLDVISNIDGQPYSEAKLISDREGVLKLYFNNGFPEATFEPSVEPDPADQSRVHLVYTVHEGPQFFVDRMVVTGLKTTRPWIVGRESLLHEGEPIGAGNMLETQRKLYDLGIFNEVNLAVANPEGRATRKNVVLQVEEAKRYTFDYGFGLEVQTGADPGGSQPQSRTGVSPRFSFDVTRINFRGRDHTIVFKSRIGRLQQRGLISYIVPRWFNKENLKFSFTTLFDTTRDVRTFTSERLEGSVQAEQTWSKATTLLYRFTYRRVKVDPDTLNVDPNLIPLLSRPVRVGIPSFSYIRDTRDNPLESSKGTYNAMDAGISSSVFGSEASFWRFFFQNSTYHLLGGRRFGRHFIFARTTRIGFEEPLDSDSPDEIPLPERYFSGGGNSHRGFAINQAGPRDRQTGFPIGGDAIFLNSMELRFPPMALPWVGENVSAVIFHDAGNVFSTAGDLFGNLFRFSQKSKRQCQLLTLTAACDLDYTSHAIGAGLRYKTPIGPVRFDIGYNLNPPTFPVRAEGRSETLKRLNFFFSIGQTF